MENERADPVAGGFAARPFSAGYMAFTLLVLLAANLLNYADRGLVGALGLPLRQAFGLDNADIGFLAGTSFALLNSLAGVALARLGDHWHRGRLLMIGVGLWSLMTASSAFATSYSQLVAARIGLGIGEATIVGIGYSMLADIFPARWRAMVFAVFVSAPLLGISLALGIAGWIVEGWAQKCVMLGMCAFADWQAAFLLFGLPGLFVAFLCGFLGEPRHRAGVIVISQERPFWDALFELTLVLPPFTLLQARRRLGRRAAFLNLAIAAITGAGATLFIALTGSVAQWTSVAIGIYGLLSWLQAQSARDPRLFALTAGTPAFCCIVFGAGLTASATAAVSTWALPLSVEALGLQPAAAGRSMGLAVAGGSLVGTLVGGLAVDLWKRSNGGAALQIAIACVLSAALLLGLLLLAEKAWLAVAAVALLMAVLSGWTAGLVALLQDIILPNMRARATTLHVATASLVAGSLGPYGVGRLADALGSIRWGMSYIFVLLVLALGLFVIALRDLPRARRRRVDFGDMCGESYR